MSYNKDIGNQTVKFEDEKSYLNYCEPLVVALDFLPFIQQERYNGDTCVVESIEPVQYVGGVDVSAGVDSSFGFIHSGSSSISAGTPIGFATGEDSGNGYYTTVATSNFPNDTVFNGNVIINGTLTVNSDSPVSISHEPDPPIEIPKVEEPEDPIDNRFDILDL